MAPAPARSPATAAAVGVLPSKPEAQTTKVRTRSLPPKGRDVSCFVQSQADRDKTWENFWVKKGMSMDLVCFWRSHSWSWEAAMSNEDLIRCVDRQDFLMEGYVAAVKVPRAEPRSEALLAE